MEIKFNCPNPECRQRISVDESLAGSSSICPACSASLQIPASASIKFICSNKSCGQHVVVDVSEAGQFIRCPACGKSLQVPGSPPKSIVQERTSKVAEKGPIPSMSKKRLLSGNFVPFKRLLFGWGIGAALCGIVMGWAQLRAWASLPRHLDAMLDETYFHGEILSAPSENHSGTALVYTRTVEKGIGVFLVDLASLERKEISVGKATTHGRSDSAKLFGWSTDDHYLAFSTIAEGDRPQHVSVCDGVTGKEIASFDIPEEVESGSWLNGNSIVLLDASQKLFLFNIEPDNHFGRFGGKGLLELRQLSRNSGWLIPDSDQSVAYVDGSSIWHFQIPENHSTRLIQQTNCTLSWLSYNPANDNYLFVATDTASKQKTLYRLDPRMTEKPLSELDYANFDFNGQWLQNDSGIAYVGIAGNRNYLAVQTKDPQLQTNLFMAPPLNPNSGLLNRQAFPEGRQVVRDFSTNPTRDKLYVVASVDYQPLGIWEYDILHQTLRNVVPITEHPKFSKFVLPVQAAVTNPSGQTVDYYYLPPAHPDPRRKYPVVMDQFSDLGYQPNSQFLANAGIFFVAVNPYGRGRPDTATDPEDTLAVYNQMIKNTNVDPHRIYVSGESAGTRSIAALLAEHSELWRGAIILSPVAFQPVDRDTKMVRSIFFSFGTEDDLVNQQHMEQYALAACAHHTTTQILYGKAGHVFFAIDEQKNRYKAVAKFILENR